MIDKNDLWIGDLLKSKKSGKVGRYEGLKSDGRIRLNVGGKIFLIKATDIEKVDEKSFFEKKFELREEKLQASLGFEKTPKSIDLHIEKLNPNLTNALPERIADYQLKAIEKYMNKVIEDRLTNVVIIHGKGTGALKTSIHTFLNSIEEVNHFHLINNDGATDVYLNY